MVTRVRTSMRTSLSGFITIGVVGVLLLTYVVWNYGRNQMWWGRADVVAQLMKDPMGDSRLMGLTLADSDETDHVALFDSPEPAFVSHWFTAPGIAPLEILGSLEDFAEAQGWVPHPLLVSSRSMTAFRDGSDGKQLKLVLSIDDEDPVHPERDGAVRVTLSYAKT